MDDGPNRSVLFDPHCHGCLLLYIDARPLTANMTINFPNRPPARRRCKLLSLGVAMGSIIVYPENEEDGDLCTAARSLRLPAVGTTHRRASRRFLVL
jgi:hypothetical protein